MIQLLRKGWAMLAGQDSRTSWTTKLNLSSSSIGGISKDVMQDKSSMHATLKFLH